MMDRSTLGTVPPFPQCRRSLQTRPPRQHYIMEKCNRLEEKEKKERRTVKSLKTSSKSDLKNVSVSHRENPNVILSIFTRKNKEKTWSRSRSLKSVEIEKFDACLIFTADEFTKYDVRLAKNFDKQPVFFVRTKIDSQDSPKELNKEALMAKLRASLNNEQKEVLGRSYEIHLISNLEPYQWEFLNLTKSIADALPPQQRASFSKIPRVEELIALNEFHSFIEEVQKKQKNATKILTNVAELKKLFTGKRIFGIHGAMNEKLNRWKDVEINLAILGNSGVGKSSFINAIRGVEDDDEESAARTGVVETTRAPTSFMHPTNPKIRFWDLPGIGTPNYPNLKVFCEKVAIETYDTFLILCAKRFTINDLLLAEKVQSMGKSFFFVRTKIDNDVRAEKRKKDFREEKTLIEIKQDCIENLKDFNYGTEKIFLVSSFYPAKWDFDRLKKAILDQLPYKQKESFALSMRSYSTDMVKEKIRSLKSRVWMVAAVSVVPKFSVGSFLLLHEGKLIKEKVKFYCEQMEFPDPDSEEFDMLSDHLQKIVKSFYPGPDQDTCEWLKSFYPQDAFKIRKHGKAGKLIRTKQPLMFVYRFLNLILDKMEDAALVILVEAAKRGGDDDSDSD